MPVLRLRGGEVDGLDVHYVVAGRGPAVLLVHGLGGFAESWRHNLPPLASAATVHAVDLPGFGRSAKPPAGYGLGFFARALAAFMDELGLARASVVGHSLGGAVAAALALTRPARVERLALISAAVPGFGYRPSWIYRLLAVPGVGEVLSLAGSAPLYKAALARCFHAPAAAEVDFFVEHAWAARTSLAARRAYLATLRGVRVDFETGAEGWRRALATLEAPVLLIHGRQDRVVPAAHCAAVARGLPAPSVRWLDHCGHFPQIEHARAVNQWLARFLVGRAAPWGTP